MVAEHLARNPEELAFDAAATIAAACGVSEATVIRLAQALGYSGFVEMQAALRVEQTRGLRTLDRQRSLSQSFKGAPDILHDVINQDIDQLQKLQADLSREAFQQAVTALCDADAVYTVGAHYSQSVAMLFFLLLQAAGPTAYLLQSGQADLEWQLARLGPRTTVVGIAFPRYSTATLNLLRFARGRQATVIGITDNPVSPVGEVADVVLPVPISTSPNTDSYTAVIALVHALFVAVAVQGKGPQEEEIRRLEDTYRVLGTFADKMKNP